MRDILPQILPASPLEAIKGTELIRLVRHKLPDDYSDATLRYQLNRGDYSKPFWIAWLRYRWATGKDPFEVVTDCITRCVANTTGTGLPLEMPTGTGFNSAQAGLTWLYASDPAVFFGGLSYLHNFPRDDLSRTLLSGGREYLGDDPGRASNAGRVARVAELDTAIEAWTGSRTVTADTVEAHRAFAIAAPESVSADALPSAWQPAPAARPPQPCALRSCRAA